MSDGYLVRIPPSTKTEGLIVIDFAANVPKTVKTLAVFMNDGCKAKFVVMRKALRKEIAWLSYNKLVPVSSRQLFRPCDP